MRATTKAKIHNVLRELEKLHEHIEDITLENVDLREQLSDLRAEVLEQDHYDEDDDLEDFDDFVGAVKPTKFSCSGSYDDYDPDAWNPEDAEWVDPY